MSDLVTSMICGCCTEPISRIPADWATARRILAREVKVVRRLLNRCEDCAHHDVYRAPCVPANFEPPRCRCGCSDR
ncbi:hypothetical protein [Nocardia sp. CC227C]|uniref:hypothetical protein n=1 Tax=Nocardia sp. CC227C TaxID=3044562 RepID=UPI00278C3DAF|nr:hypothetical protein [Nocardia sp. CC227C]